MRKDKSNPLLDYDGFLKAISKKDETPRSIVILVCAFLDAQLRLILSNSFIKGVDVVNNLFYGELFSFATKVKISYCMGLIGTDVFDDLLVMGKIRNSFAHEMQDYTFDDVEVVENCNKFRLAKINISNSPSNSHQRLFMDEVLLLMQKLSIIIVETKNRKIESPKDIRFGGRFYVQPSKPNKSKDTTES